MVHMYNDIGSYKTDFSKPSILASAIPVELLEETIGF